MQTATPIAYPFADLALARRLERAEGRMSAACVAVRASAEPAVGAAWSEIGGAYALFDGRDSFLTQTFGLGVFEPAGPDVLEGIEAFFHARGAAVHHEVSPLAGDAPRRLAARGYRPVEATNVLYRPAAGPPTTTAPDLRVRLATPEEADVWAEVAAQGWADDPAAADFMRTYGRLLARADGVYCFLAEQDGRPVAAAALGLHARTALFAGASTIPEARGRGAQRALLEVRLRHAVAHGCDLAMLGALPGSASQRNAERHGFRIAYTRTKWSEG